MEQMLIRGARLIDPETDGQQTADILIEDGRIAAVAPEIDAADAVVLSADGLYCAPGLFDMHVHLREPGQTQKEDIHSGCRAAAAGGVTSLVCMPNTQPAVDAPETVRAILETALTADCRVYPAAAVTAGLGGERLTDFASLKAAGAVAVSDDGRPVPTNLMPQALQLAKENGLPLLSHAEELALVCGGIMNEGIVSQRLGLPGISRAAEETATARDIAMAERSGCPVHICHVSTAGSVEMLRQAQKRGVPVTGETAPHYFSLTDEALCARDADYRMSPPLRTARDVEAVIAGLADGTLSVIATDHAPHTPQDKADFEKAPNGAIGMETSLAVGLTFLVHTGRLSLAALLRAMSLHPARLLGRPGGTLSVGAPADLVLFNPQEEWTVDPDRLHGKSKNTPFKGMTLRGRVKATLLGGRITYLGLRKDGGSYGI